MYTDSFTQPDGEVKSYGSIIRELGMSAKDLIQSEISLMTAELKHVAQDVGRHSAQAAAFGALLALSVFPFLAFVVIGLGDLLDGRYWLSSLIVAVICAAVGGPLAYRAFRKIKENDIKFTHSKAKLQRGLEAFSGKIDQVKDAARGDRYGQQHH
ncbi:MAG: phage holin family protein [Pseudobdellovibrionaceae bacterium]